MMEGGDAQKSSEALPDEKWSCCRWFKYLLIRLLIIIVIFTISIMIPNLNVMLTFVGAALGTLMNVWLPVIFYNRAYNNSDKNSNLEGGGDKQMEDGQPRTDPRRCIKIWSWIVFAVGTVIGVWGIVYCVFEVLEAKEDEV